MKISLSWLQQYLDLQMPIAQVAEKLTMNGLEVESLTDRFAFLETVVVGSVQSASPHPDADRLKVCQVLLKDETRTIVCGAPNVAAGQLVPVALPGTVLPGGVEIRPSSIRGVKSAGMICSKRELEIGAEEDGIMVLEKGAPGDALNSVLGLYDPVIEIGLTPNRGDCLSMLGMAREMAAFAEKPLVSPELKAARGTLAVMDLATVAVESPALCPRFSAAVVQNVKIGPSPFWLQDRLRSVGLRPVNNVVDITNFVMLELGQPMHAYDYDLLAEHRIVVKTADKDQKFTTLDGKTHTLTDEMLMICDGQKAVGIAGVMGGQNSEINAETRHILLESAHFNPASVRRTAKRLGIATDASHRFERGVDPNGTVTAVERALALMAETCGGEIADGVLDVYPEPVKARPIEIDCRTVSRTIGFALDQAGMAKPLQSIGFTVETIDENRLAVTPPTFRFDMARPVDLIEEIARLAGYDKIPVRFPPMTYSAKPPSAALQLRTDMRQFMTGAGFWETVNYSFIHREAVDLLGLAEGDVRRQQTAIMNPLSEDQTVMRSVMAPGLFKALARNIAQQMRDLRLFEVGKVFIGEKTDHLPNETEMLAGVWSGNRYVPGWLEKPVACDFYDLKGVVEALLGALGIKNAVFAVPASPEEQPFYQNGRVAQICLGQAALGTIGAVRQAVLKSFEIGQDVFYFELDLGVLEKHLDSHLRIQPIPQFPATSRDITLIVDRQTPSAEIPAWLKGCGEALIESVELFDLFEGEPVPEKMKSVSVRVVYRSPETTLADSEINQLHTELSAKLVAAFDARLPA